MTCKTCKYATFELTPTGRIKRNLVGRCSVPAPAPPVAPACFVFSKPLRAGVWPDMGAACTAWESK